MSLGFSIARALLLKRQMNDKPCPRCGLCYNPATTEHCPHCAHLSDRDLQKLAADQEAAKHANKMLGFWFMLAGVVIGGAMLIAFT